MGRSVRPASTASAPRHRACGGDGGARRCDRRRPGLDHRHLRRRGAARLGRGRGGQLQHGDGAVDGRRSRPRTRRRPARIDRAGDERSRRPAARGAAVRSCDRGAVRCRRNDLRRSGSRHGIDEWELPSGDGRTRLAGATVDEGKSRRGCPVAVELPSAPHACVGVDGARHGVVHRQRGVRHLRHRHPRAVGLRVRPVARARCARWHRRVVGRPTVHALPAPANVADRGDRIRRIHVVDGVDVVALPGRGAVRGVPRLGDGVERADPRSASTVDPRRDARSRRSQLPVPRVPGHALRCAGRRPARQPVRGPFGDLRQRQRARCWSA